MPKDRNTKSIGVSVDKIIDKKLINWLESKRNKSSFIRDTLYAKMYTECEDSTVINEPSIKKIERSEPPRKVVEEEKTTPIYNEAVEKTELDTAADVAPELLNNIFKSMHNFG